MTPEELANNELEKLRKNGKLTFPLDPFKILSDAGVYIVLKKFENLAGIIINDEDNCTIVGINSNDSWQRQRFTAAHEYCHFIKDLNKEKVNMAFINIMCNMSVDCDCCAEAEDPCMKDIGILASLDPVAIDQACLDLVYQSNDPRKEHFLQRVESRHGVHTIEAAADLGIGSREYELIVLN